MFAIYDALTLSAPRGGGGNLPMARKFRNSSNSAEFGALALLDFSPFVITKPWRPVSAKLDHPERNYWNKLLSIDRKKWSGHQFFCKSQLIHAYWKWDIFRPLSLTEAWIKTTLKSQFQCRCNRVKWVNW